MKDNAFSKWIKGRNAGLWFGILYLAYSIFFFAMSFNYPYHATYGPGAGLYPRWLSGLSIVVSVLYIGQSVLKDKFRIGDKFPSAKELLNVLLIFVSCLVFMFLLNTLGFNVAGSLLLFTVFVRQYKVWKGMLYSVSITVVCYLIFKVFFSVPLPRNMFGF